MQQSEIDTRNKALSEFMGWELVAISNSIDYETCLFRNIYTEDIYDGSEMEILNSQSTMRYNLDWSWLMEVIEKIESMNMAVVITPSHCIIKNDDFFIKEVNDTRTFILRPGKNKKEAVFIACSDFAIEYLKNKEK